MQFLHVVQPPAGAMNRTPYLADPEGRRVMLRGAAEVGMSDVAYPGADGGPAIYPITVDSYNGKCPVASPLVQQPPVCEVQASKPEFSQSTAPGSGDDFAQMRELGFNVTRLVLQWSELEPEPGQYSTQYLDRIAQVVGWARQQGIYVILDMHQDQYSRFILPGSGNPPSGCAPSGGSDGAPAWAVFTNEEPACALYGETALNPAALAAFYAFWHNHQVPGPEGSAPGNGLQDHYIGALAALANRFSGDPAVLGYEIMNEPQPGVLWSKNALSPPAADPYTASAQDLYPFYKRVIEALTGVRDGMETCASTADAMSGTCSYPKLANVSQQEIFYEPLAYRNITDFSIQVSKPFSEYPNLVYAPHIYTHAFTADAFLGYTPSNSPYPPSYTFGYQTAEAEAQAMHSAILVTEFGDNSGSDDQVLAGEVAAQDATLTSSTLWAWKGLATTESSCWCVRWQSSDYDTTTDGTPGSGNPNVLPGPDNLIPSRHEYLAQVTPRFSVGILLGYVYDPSTAAFAMAATVPKGERPVEKGDYEQETELWIPPGDQGEVSTSGQAVVDHVTRQPDGSRLAFIRPLGAGSYQVEVGSPSQDDLATLASDEQLQPIQEPQARALALGALATARNSSDPRIRTQAILASVLAGIILPSPDPNS